MKKILIVLLAVAILAAASIALAGGVSGTKHDVRVVKAENALEPCAWCHTPHQGNVTTYPLWNRSQATQTYTPYSSSTFNMGVSYKAKADLDEGSAPCMVCHNGVESTLVNYPGRGNTIVNALYNLDLPLAGGNSWADLGTDLKNEHPVSFTYNKDLDNNSGQNNGFPSSDNGEIHATAMDFPLYRVAAGTGNATEFGCATCHTVHHTPTTEYMETGTGTYQVYFLRMSNEGSDMCAACHVNRY